MQLSLKHVSLYRTSTAENTQEIQRNTKDNTRYHSIFNIILSFRNLSLILPQDNGDKMTYAYRLLVCFMILKRTPFERGSRGTLVAIK